MVRSWDVGADVPPFDVRPLLPDERIHLVMFLGQLTDDQWHAPTVNLGWSVHDVALHLLGNDIGRAGEPAGEPARRGEVEFDALARLIEESNEAWIRAARRISPALLVDLLAFMGPRVDAALAAVDLASPGVAVAWTGTGPTPYWLDIAREYTERWVHHAQIRLALGCEPLVQRRWLHPVLDAFMRSLPRAYQTVKADEGARVEVEIGGDAGGRWTVQRGRDRWHLVAACDGEPTATVRMDQDTAWRLLSRTISVDAALPAIRIEGDPLLGSAATRAVAIMTTRS
jgi:uncharacterized protein (TIGR03083 family)